MDIRKTLFTILCVCLSLSAFAQSDWDASEADAAYDFQEYQKSFELYTKCIETDSTQIHCYERGAQSAYRLGDIPNAKQLFHKLEEIDTFNRIALSQLSAIYELEKNAPKAIKYYTKLRNLFPENPVYHRKLGQQYQAAGLMTEAFENYSAAYKLNKRDMFSIQGIAEIFIANKQYEEADSLLLEGLSLDSLNVNFSLLIAQSKYRQKLFDSTVHYLERIQYEIDFSPYFNKMFGYAYIQIDSFEKSIPLLEKSLIDEGSKEYAHYYLATAYESMDSTEWSLYHYEKALDEGISSNTDLYHRNLARMYNDAGKLREAIEHYKDAYKYGEDPLVLFYLARACDIYYKDKSVAVNYYSKYIRSSEPTVEYKQYAKDRRQILREQMHQGM